MTNLPANLDDEADRMLHKTASVHPRLLFKKGKYYVDDGEIKLGHKYIAFPRDWTHGWVRWLDDGTVVERLGKVVEWDPPLREELGDLDNFQWKDGKDPWQKQNILPVVDLETDEFLLFCSSSWGGLKAIQKLVNKYYSEIKAGRALGNPIIAIGTYERSTKEYGLIPSPKFDIVSWENPEASLPPLTDDLEDEIPFREHAEASPPPHKDDEIPFNGAPGDEIPF